MENLKQQLGERIRKLREKQGLTRAEFCQTEEELTSKQLMRIELGQSLPTLIKLQFISLRLGVEVSDLIGDTSLELPEDYIKVKYQLVRTPTYADRERIEAKKVLIDGLYNRYYNFLPEEELLTLDIIERFLNLAETGEDLLIEEIYGDYLNQVMRKKVYTLNDLHIIDYFALQCQDLNYQKAKLDHFKKYLLKQEVSVDDNYNIGLLSALVTSLGAYYLHGELEVLLEIINRLHDIVSKTLLYAYTPGILCFEAKYYLSHQDRKKTKELYQRAIILAEQIGDSVLIKNLKMEMTSDLG